MKLLATHLMVLMLSCLIIVGGQCDMAHSNRDMTQSKCQPPDTTSTPDAEFANLVGVFVIELHVTQGARRDTIVQGRLTLEVSARARRFGWAAAGWMEAPLTRLGNVPIGSPEPSSKDPEHPGVLVFKDRGRFFIVVGGARLNAMAVDQGVDLDVQNGDRTGFTGTWSAGTNVRPVPAGYFCAWRLPES